MERREFLGWAGVGVLASCLPVVIAACSSSPTTDSNETSVADSPQETAAVPDAEGFLTVGSVSQLQQDGYLANSAAKVIVVQGDNNNLFALNPTCTHQQCTVEWRQASGSLTCPCHGSEFSTDGKVLKGPAEQPLPSYEVKQEADSVLVKVS